MKAQTKGNMVQLFPCWFNDLVGLKTKPHVTFSKCRARANLTSGRTNNNKNPILGWHLTSASD